jgi:hypothetical protein
MTDTDVKIADALEKVQRIDPELYGKWYSKLYPPYGDNENWNMETLNCLNNLVGGND